MTLPKLIFILPFLVRAVTSTGQDNGFEFGKILYDELNMTVYNKDTSAAAVVLNEFGDAFFDDQNLNKIIFRYHSKVKILKEEGREYGSVKIPLRKLGNRQEIVTNIQASSFNTDGNVWKEQKLQPKDIYQEKVSGEFSVIKFAVPGVVKGSVVEIYYQLETPFTFNFISWDFQSEIPKVKSEFWGKYPGYYQYNATLKGFLKLAKNQADIVSKCVRLNSGPIEAGADCVLLKYGMANVPAFEVEDYMTSKANFISSISFELSQITQPDGRIDKITKEWKDAEKELKLLDSFGGQIKKSKNVFEKVVSEFKAQAKDQLSLANRIFDFIKASYSWNGEHSKYTNVGIKKLVEVKKGNVGDINLSLLVALQQAEFDADPVLVSTRENGLPVKTYPVLSDFNYVIVRLKLDGKVFYLDATSPLYPFGFVPQKCLNGQGRLVGENSSWVDVTPSGIMQVDYSLEVLLDGDGVAHGTITITHSGYGSFDIRESYHMLSDKESFIKERSKSWTGFSINSYQVENDTNLNEPFIEKIEGVFETQRGGELIYFEPFIIDRLNKNPFHSRERKYPVDFAVPIKNTIHLAVRYPNNFRSEGLPEKMNIELPQNGGEFSFNALNEIEKITVVGSLVLNKAQYTPYEYPALKNLYSNYISALRSQIVIRVSK